MQQSWLYLNILMPDRCVIDILSYCLSCFVNDALLPSVMVQQETETI